MGFAAFNDSPAGIALGTVLHTVGAIALLGGLVAYLLWARHLRHGRDEPQTLLAAQAATVVAIVANLVGGFLRTYQSDHPRITELRESAWVRVLLVKHVFLFAAMAAALVLLFVVARRLRQRFSEGVIAKPSGREQALVGLALAGIAVAALLGAVGVVTPLRDVVDDMAMPPDHEGNHTEEVVAVAYANFTGQLTSTPVAPAQATGDFLAPAGTVRMVASLTWSPTQMELGFDVTGPNGGCTAEPTAGGGASCTFEDTQGPAPEAFDYTYTVWGGAVVAAAQWRLEVRMEQAPSNDTNLVATVTIPPGTFYEINTDMPGNATLRWDWTSDAVVAFDVHSHFDGEVQYWVEEETDAHAGSLTIEREGGYSYLWANDGSLPVTLTYRVWGPFTVDSYFPPESG